MNLKYLVVVKKDQDKFLTTSFIAPVEETSWLSPIVVVPKKMESYTFASISEN
jgi:hypothetical protein